jgi:hypothetical protein
MSTSEARGGASHRHAAYNPANGFLKDTFNSRQRKGEFGNCRCNRPGCNHQLQTSSSSDRNSERKGNPQTEEQQSIVRIFQPPSYPADICNRKKQAAIANQAENAQSLVHKDKKGATVTEESTSDQSSSISVLVEEATSLPISDPPISQTSTSRRNSSRYSCRWDEHHQHYRLVASREPRDMMERGIVLHSIPTVLTPGSPKHRRGRRDCWDRERSILSAILLFFSGQGKARDVVVQFEWMKA